MGSAPGVSVVVCTHDGAARLPETLAHLAGQRVPPGLAWEVIVVDNGSTDDSAGVARASWPASAPVPLRVVPESRLGLVFARARGLSEAQHTLVSFVDDDNWVAPDWVALAWQVMQAHPEAAACGGDCEPVLDGPARAWFERHAAMLAVGRQGEAAGDAGGRGYLWGAGLTVRVAAWEALRAGGFEHLVLGPRGSMHSGGDDIELCYALTLGGWRLRYDPRLRLRHAIRASRLTWDHLRLRGRAWGRASVRLDPYHMAMGAGGLRRPLLRSWSWRLAAALGRLLWLRARALADPGEGSDAVIRLEIGRGRLEGVLAERRTLRENWRRVRDAAWRQPPGAGL